MLQRNIRRPRSRRAGAAMVVMICGMATAVPSRSAAQEPGGPLTLEAATRIALDRNPADRAAREGVAIAREAVGEARAPYYPEVGVASGYARWERHAYLPSGFSSPNLASTIGPTNDWFAGLTGSYLLFDGGQRAAELRAAMARQAGATDEAARIRQDLVLAVHRAYFGLGGALDARVVADENLARAEDHLRLARERRAAGAVAGADVIRAQVDVADARLRLVRAQSLIRVGAGQLNSVMGLPVETPVTLTADREPVAPPDDVDLPAALRDAIQARPVLEAARQRVSAAASAVEATQSVFRPKIRTDWGYGLRDSEFFPRDPDWSVGVSVRWSLFNGYATEHRVARARLEQAKDQAELAGLELIVRNEAWSAYWKLKESFEAIEAAAVLVTGARDSVRVATERYAAGAGTVTEMLDAEAALARAEAARVEAQWGHRVARSTFAWATGHLAVPATPDNAPPTSARGRSWQ
ncbi:MAG: TolC family protein [Acidobacteria bacterium]|nr:TolC family protein [Acidobacteriota bacterium]